jgi:hypothetical protein
VPVMHMVSASSQMPGVLAFGQRATGIVAIGQEATGVIAIGQLATGVVAVGQLARGVIAVGQLSLGLAAVGQVAVGVLWCAGIGVGGTAGPGLVFGLFGRPSRQRLIAWVRREPWDSARRPAWRLAGGAAGLAALVALWWVAAGQALTSALT